MKLEQLSRPSSAGRPIASPSAASEGGIEQASFELGLALLEGSGEEPQPAAAVEVFGRAAEQGIGREAALRRLRAACFYAPDALEPCQIRKEIEELKEDDADGSAALLRGYFHYRRFGYEEDPAEAVKWHETAASRGNADAMFELSVLYSSGQGVEPNPDLATEWTIGAAKAGSKRAMYNLGTAFATGNGVEQSTDFAVEWYEKAARAGHGRAAATLSMMYFVGEEVEADNALAEDYFYMAYELGYDAYALFFQMGIEHPF